MTINAQMAERLGLPRGPWSRTRRAYRSSKSKTLHHYDWCLNRRRRWNSEMVVEEVDLVAITEAKTCSSCGSHLERGDIRDREYAAILRELDSDADAAQTARWLIDDAVTDRDLTRCVGRVRQQHAQQLSRRARLVTDLTELDARSDGTWEPVTESVLERFDAFHETIAQAIDVGESRLGERLQRDDRFALQLALDQLRRIYRRDRTLTGTDYHVKGVDRLQSTAFKAWHALRGLDSPQPKMLQMVYMKVRDQINCPDDHATIAWGYVPTVTTMDPSQFSNPRDWAVAETEAALECATVAWVEQFELDLQRLLQRHAETAEIVYVTNYMDLGHSDRGTELEGFGKLLQLLPRIGLAHKTLVLAMSPLIADWLQMTVSGLERVASADDANLRAAEAALGYLDHMNPQRAHHVALALVS